MAYLGLDLGTSGLRALLTDETGSPIASAEAPCPTAHPASGWSEQDPADWIAALEAAIAALRSEPAFRDIRGIAVSGHMHGAVLLDAADQPLRPCIMWNDTRAHAEASAMDANPAFRAITGNIVFPGFTAPKLAWSQHHEPEVFTRIAKVLLPAAYLNLYLTGDNVSDLSDAAGTAWLDTGAGRWSEELLTAGGMRPDQMPRLTEGCAPAGTLRPALARKWGLGEVTVAGGAGDNAAAACGVGALAEGAGFLSLGTSGVILIAREGYSPAPETAVHTFRHAVPDRWIQMSVMLSATDSLNWLAALFSKTPKALTAALGPDLAAPSPLTYLPYLSGERTPHNDAAARGAFLGLTRATDRREMTRAVLEGVAFGLRDGLEAIRATGAAPEILHAVGGGARSDYWLRLCATVLNVTLLRPKGGEFGAALGAARLAMTAATGKEPAAIMTPPEDCETFAPDANLFPAYEAAYRRFRDAYPSARANP